MPENTATTIVAVSAAGARGHVAPVRVAGLVRFAAWADLDGIRVDLGRHPRRVAADRAVRWYLTEYLPAALTPTGPTL